MATQPVERPGPLHRIAGWVSEVGRSFFPSMGLTDWRSVLRGEAAPRPNPRMRVHNNSFWYHIRPRSLPEEARSEEHTSELQSHVNLVCRLLLEKKKKGERSSNI